MLKEDLDKEIHHSIILLWKLAAFKKFNNKEIVKLWYKYVVKY